MISAPEFKASNRLIQRRELLRRDWRVFAWKVAVSQQSHRRGLARDFCRVTRPQKRFKLRNFAVVADLELALSIRDMPSCRRGASDGSFSEF